MFNNNLIYTNTEIQTAWLDFLETSTTYFKNVPEDIFYKNQNGKWSIAENLDHLIRSTKPVASGLKLPKIAFRALGKPNRPSRSYDDLKIRYKEKLAQGGAASGAYIPESDKLATQQELCETWKAIGLKFSKRITGKWSDEALEKYLMPHPLLGKLTVREMLYFTILHGIHHFETALTYHPMQA